MKKISVLILFILLACSDKKEQTQISDEFNSKSSKLKLETNENLNNISIDSLWYAVTQKRSCLTGEEYGKNGIFYSERCIMDQDEEWKALFGKPKKDLAEFLIAKLESPDTTEVHTCPFFFATEGELAVYTLQRIYKKNWFDFDEFKIYKERADKPQESPVSNRESYQGWLHDEVLGNPKNLKTLKQLWLIEMNK